MPQSSKREYLYAAIYQGMIYWFNRLIREQPARDSYASKSRTQHARYDWAVDRRRYRRRRAMGLSAAEAKYETLAQHRTRCARYRTRWGGTLHPGSEAWKRRLLAAHGVEMEGR